MRLEEAKAPSPTFREDLVTDTVLASKREKRKRWKTLVE